MATFEELFNRRPEAGDAIEAFGTAPSPEADTPPPPTAAPARGRPSAASLFEDLPMAGAGQDGPKPATPPAATGRRTAASLFEDLPMTKAAEPSKTDGAASIAGDLAQSAGAGLIKGAAGLLDLPQTAYGILDGVAGWAAHRVANAGRAAFNQPVQPETDTRSQSVIPSPADLPKPGETLLHGLEAATGKLYEPQTTAGKFARTAAEFIPGAGKRLGEAVAYGVIPGLASEGAGQLTEGSALEPFARAGAGVAAGLGGAAFRAPGNAEKLVADRMKGVSPQQVDQAEALFQEAAARGLPLTRANAVDAVTNGVTSLSDLQRVLEGNGRLKEFYAPTAGAVEREGRGTLDTVAAPGATPTALGGEVQAAARAGVAQTPQGMALTEVQAAAGPRVTPEQAGQVIQPELRRVYDRREGMRAALGEQDYAAARAAPETVGIERTVPVERPGEPVTTYPKLSRPEFTDQAPRPLEPSPAASPAAAGGDRSAQGMLDYLARNGGIPLEAETRAGDLNRAYRPGAGTLARNGAPTWDQIRVRLAEEGFLPPDLDGAARTGDVRDFVLDALHQERIGRGRTVRMGEEANAPRRGGEADEFANARSLAESRLHADLTNAGVDPASVHPDVQSRVVGALMRGEASDPLQAYERTVGAMKGPLEPYSRATTVTEQIPDVRFGQANPQGVVDHIDEALGSAKGPVAKALAAARETLFTNASPGRPRELDLSVAGLHGAREAINDLIAKAEPTAQRALMGVRERLDGALSSVPEYEHARSGFEAASRNLDPFAPSAAPGRIVDREQTSGRHTLAPENVPAAIDAGPSQGRAFNEVAPPAARQAYEGHMRTALLDAATDARTGEVSSGKIRELLRQNEDGLRQFPAVREHLEGVAFAREGREAVDRSPLGRIASDPKVEKAIGALFPANPLPGSSAEVGDAVRRMAAAHPRATSELVRMHMEQVFNEATQRLQSGANQAGGAKFSTVLVGNREQAASMEAAVKALPGGDKTWAGVRRLLDIFDAQGVRQAVGSGTSFNNTIQADLKAGKPIGEAGAAIATGGIKLPTRIMDKIEGWRMGRGLDEMARLFTDPKMAGMFRRLATQPPNSAAGIAQLATMIVGRAVRGYNSGQRPDPAAGAEREPLKLTVRPSP